MRTRRRILVVGVAILSLATGWAANEYANYMTRLWVDSATATAICHDEDDEVDFESRACQNYFEYGTKNWHGAK